MSDQALDWMVNTLHALPTSPEQQLVWCIDENALHGIPDLPHKHLQLITNRWDIAEQANANSLQVQFNDFDFSGHEDNSVDVFFYRVSKEKPLVHHLLNQAWRCLKPGGQLYVSGFKNDGTKTYIEKIAKLMQCDKNTKKNGQIYSARLIKNAGFDPQIQLDNSDYRNLRPIATDSGLALLSKPGLFGWNKIDAGSALLIEYLPQALNNRPTPESCLDLGCGYGYLTIAASKILDINAWLMTDNNSAALAAAAENLKINNLTGRVIAADAGQGIQEKVDLLLCNPPFHQGFNIDGDLTDKFLHNAQRLLAPRGIALFVVNQFIPLERKATSLFNEIKTLADNGSFKVISLAN
ncbi:methyltransferase [Cellvibrio sp. UBA7661]|uniref:methyltransferase n=1 Tax=Cellvibrio sp. UBA7661 TaxID=1946311 RepID=UPI002F353858